jgi:general secretion pathway protein L
MARLAGIDIGSKIVRVAVIRTAYRKVFLESLAEAPIGDDGPAAAIEAAMQGLKPESIAVALPGDRCYCRRVELPLAAQKELENVLTLELESSIPFEMEGAVFDKRQLKSPDPQTLLMFAAIARVDDVQRYIDVVREGVGREPESVDTGSLALANLVPLVPELSPKRVPIPVAPGEPPAFEQPGPVAVLDLGEARSELVVLDGGEAAFVRTVSRGTEGLPGNAPAIARELKQSFAAWRALGGAPVSALFLVGTGAGVAGAETYLSSTLGVPVSRLPAARLDGVTPDQLELLPFFARAVALALSLSGRSRSLNLRQGPLEAAQSFAFLREKLPLLSGLGAVILVSFGFSIVAELRALSSERVGLDEQLKVTTREVLGEETLDIARANELLEKGPAGEDDPAPGVDAFDVMVQLSKAVPQDIVHDVADFDVARGHAVIQGLVPTGTDAQKAADRIAAAMRENPCLRDVKVQKTTQHSSEKQKYILEMDLRCEDKKDPKKKPASGTTPAASAKEAE